MRKQIEKTSFSRRLKPSAQTAWLAGQRAGAGLFVLGAEQGSGGRLGEVLGEARAEEAEAPALRLDLPLDGPAVQLAVGGEAGVLVALGEETVECAKELAPEATVLELGSRPTEAAVVAALEEHFGAGKLLF